jgi:hypothetical protein
MSVSLADALREVELVPGHVYYCEVGGQRVELRVLPSRTNEPVSIPESEILLEPWIELPEPPPTRIGVSRKGVSPSPDVPDIPTEWDGL